MSDDLFLFPPADAAHERRTQVRACSGRALDRDERSDARDAGHAGQARLPRANPRARPARVVA
jgi:hypothetical protein